MRIIMLRRIRYSQWKKALSEAPQHNCQRNIIGPPTPSALAKERTFQPHVQAAAGVVVHVADDPVIAAAATVREIVPADGLDMLGEAAGQSPSGAFHRSLPRQGF